MCVNSNSCPIFNISIFTKIRIKFWFFDQFCQTQHNLMMLPYFYSNNYQMCAVFFTLSHCISILSKGWFVINFYKQKISCDKFMEKLLKYCSRLDQLMMTSTNQSFYTPSFWTDIHTQICLDFNGTFYGKLRIKKNLQP